MHIKHLLKLRRIIELFCWSRSDLFDFILRLLKCDTRFPPKFHLDRYFFLYLCILKYRTFFILAFFRISELRLCHFLSTSSLCTELLSEISTTVTHSESTGCQSAVPNRLKSEGKGGNKPKGDVELISFHICPS